MVRPIPPLNALHVFEVASRLGSFTKAAEELNVTQSAVSRQIATLEAYLGMRLFVRDRTGIRLTEKGSSFSREIRDSFGRLSSATATILGEQIVRPLRVRAHNTFVSTFLIPRLARFYAQHPDIVVRFDTRDIGYEVADFGQDDLDLAIQFGDGDWPGLDCTFLWPDTIQPYCSAKIRDRVTDVDSLSEFWLLRAVFRREDWEDWLAVNDGDVRDMRWMDFVSSFQTYQAASEGIGVAMGQVQLLTLDVAIGRLVPLFRPLTRHGGYFIVFPQSGRLSAKAKKFVTWLMQEAKSVPHSL